MYTETSPSQNDGYFYTRFKRLAWFERTPKKKTVARKNERKKEKHGVSRTALVPLNDLINFYIIIHRRRVERKNRKRTTGECRVVVDNDDDVENTTPGHAEERTDERKHTNQTASERNKRRELATLPSRPPLHSGNLQNARRTQPTTAKPDRRVGAA